MSFTAGYEAVLAYAKENTSVGAFNPLNSEGTELVSIPSAPLVIGYANVPGVKVERGSKKGFGIGSPFALYNGKGTRRYEVSIDAPLTGAGLLSYLLRPSDGYKGLADLCLFVGTSNIADAEFGRVIRFAKCNSFTLNLTEGSAQEVRLQATLMGLFEQMNEGEVSFPETHASAQSLTSAGAPYFWNTVMKVDVKRPNAATATSATTVEMRDFISSVSISGNHNVKPRGFRAGADDSNPLHLTHYSLIPGKFVGKATLGLHEKLPASLRTATADATVWGDVVIDLQQTGKSMRITLHDCILDPDSQNGGDDGDNAIQYGCDVHFSKMTLDTIPA